MNTTIIYLPHTQKQHRSRSKGKEGFQAQLFSLINFLQANDDSEDVWLHPFWYDKKLLPCSLHVSTNCIKFLLQIFVSYIQGCFILAIFSLFDFNLRRWFTYFSNDNDFLELVWENGEIVVRGGSSSNRSRKTNEERIHEDASINKRTRLNPLYSLEDHFLPQRDSDMSSSHQSNNGQDSCQSSESKNSCKLMKNLQTYLSPLPQAIVTYNSAYLHLRSRNKEQ